MPQKSIQIKTIIKVKDAKKNLINSIKKKRAELKQLVIKVELLKVNLQIAKNEYMVKVGSLFLKDNQLDLEIIRHRNILSLMERGMTYDKASDEIAKTYYAKQIEIENEKQKIQDEKEIFEKREAKHDTHGFDIKKLWKKLISKFHPDLTQNRQEKLKRDGIMKQINRAYQEEDYEQLLRIEKENFTYEENTIDDLEEALILLTNEIFQQAEEYDALKTSEWYGWMEKINKARKKNVNIFAETEKKLLDDIVAKFAILKELRALVQEKEDARPSTF